MISMAPSSLTAGGPPPRAPPATASTMGAKRSSIARMLEAGAWTLAVSGCGAFGVADLRPGGFRFTPRLSHARIPGHGLQALSRAGTVPGGAPRLARGPQPGGLGNDSRRAQDAGGAGRVPHRLAAQAPRRGLRRAALAHGLWRAGRDGARAGDLLRGDGESARARAAQRHRPDRKSTRLNSSHQ